MGKRLFNVFKHHVSGCNYLLRKLIQLPIIAQCNATPSDSAEQPASLMKCINDWQEHKKTDEYKAAVARSKKRSSDRSRLSKQIWEQSQELSKAKALSTRAGKGQFFDLSWEEQQLVEDYDCGRLERSLQRLLSKRAPIYRGIGASVKGR